MQHVVQAAVANEKSGSCLLLKESSSAKCLLVLGLPSKCVGLWPVSVKMGKEISKGHKLEA